MQTYRREDRGGRTDDCRGDVSGRLAYFSLDVP